MLKSMTAYGRSDFELGKNLLTAEIKTLNNRYRDIILRLPAALQGHEEFIRAEISERVKRGRIEVSIQLTASDETTYNLELNRPLLDAYKNIFNEMNREFGTDEKIKPEFFLQLRDSIIQKTDETDPEELKNALSRLLGQTLDSLETMRINEGNALADDLDKRLALIKGYLDKIEERAPSVVTEYKEKLKSRIEAISDELEVDEARLAQEVALFAGRCDITEEIVRAGSHLVQFHAYMEMDDSVGRRLDFLIQELNREINTISSKASDSIISTSAVEVKAELEKIREQIQNIE
ncbi:MAG: YicC family protein [Deltaproteobacteria bacterium]|nr:YicC family protein [Deltaproteobacteria bacterium]